MRTSLVVLWAAAVTVLTNYPAMAHHSFAMFDNDKEIVIQGTVTEFQWTNPHTWIELDVADAKGQTTHWSIEAGSVAGLSRQGWTRHTLQAGDKISLVAHPMRDGKPGGSLMGVTLADGKHLGASLEQPKTSAN
jgi:Family of unknown function (DUF6152)